MKIKILGGGWYGCHLAVALRDAGYDVTLFESRSELFSGASGANPARLHLGFHYPRSMKTRLFSQEHYRGFMDRYGDLTKSVPINVYAVAEDDSMVDFGTYLKVLCDEVSFVPIDRPSEFGLRNVEGAVLTGERHIVISEARKYFTDELSGKVQLNTDGKDIGGFDWAIDCTFCSYESISVQRFEPCVTGILRGPSNKAVTIMDGPFPSVYPWDESKGLSSLTSAKYTPLKRCDTYLEARSVLDHTSLREVEKRVKDMYVQLSHYLPEIEEYEVVDSKLSVRAMPRSGADARLVELARTGDRTLSIRAGKIDAVMYAEKLVMEALSC